jgi:hypothetical protein
MDLITVHTALNPMDADLVFSRLDAAQFHPSIKNALSALTMDGYALAAGGILVQVPEDEAGPARAFLADSVTAPEETPGA